MQMETKASDKQSTRASLTKLLKDVPLGADCDPSRKSQGAIRRSETRTPGQDPPPPRKLLPVPSSTASCSPFAFPETAAFYHELGTQVRTLFSTAVILKNNMETLLGGPQCPNYFSWPSYFYTITKLLDSCTPVPT